MTDYECIGTNVRVRRTTSATSKTNIVGRLQTGDRVDVLRVFTPPEFGAIEWAETRSAIGSRVMDDQPLYVATQWLRKVEPPPPVVNVRARVGVNVLQNHRDLVQRAYGLGCRYFMIFNDIIAAEQTADTFRDAIVMARIYWNRSMPTPQQAFDALAGGRNPRLIYTGLNEADEIGQDAKDIQKRAEFDIELAGMVKRASGATYAAGTFSMGTPDFTNPEVCDAIRKHYAPAYNAGLISWDHHLYSPDMDHIYRVDDLIWFETRWRQLFHLCGFNPLSKSRVYCSEMGLDKYGVGGFPANGASAQQVAEWSELWASAQMEALKIGTTYYPSPFVGGAIFQVGNHYSGQGGWAGYEVSYAMDELHSSGVWQ